MDRRFVVELVERLPQGLLSRAWGSMARRRRPRLGVEVMKRAFVAATGIDMSEASEAIETYSTLEDLFVRRLRPGARRIDPDPAAFVSPVDAKVGACGKVAEGMLLQIKGRRYSLDRLLQDGQEAARFEGGAYATLYLSPRDYHRIHAPLAGAVARATLVPGRLLPVFEEALLKVDELFARNERLITYLDSPDAGRVAVVKVGATLVGRISVAYDPEIHTNESGQVTRPIAYDPPHLLQKGAELGAFELGSTVVLVCEPERVRLEGLKLGGFVRMGQRIGTIRARTMSARRAASGRPRRRDGAEAAGKG
jgi:phosphatidylserine decarboxylase